MFCIRYAIINGYLSERYVMNYSLGIPEYMFTLPIIYSIMSHLENGWVFKP